MDSAQLLALEPHKRFRLEHLEKQPFFTESSPEGKINVFDEMREVSVTTIRKRAFPCLLSYLQKAFADPRQCTFRHEPSVEKLRKARFGRCVYEGRASVLCDSHIRLAARLYELAQ